MPKIKKLPAHEAQKIAAGEVVERPANIVKELIENAIDAGATRITIYVEQAGKKNIRIVDNGCGMDTEDALLCFEHHATSKIQRVEDLEAISTFGFRGEALSSIASVSTITLTTKTTENNEGIQLIIKNGNLLTERAVATTTGTDITVEHLFEALPARKKFLKTKETEWRHIQQLFYAITLAYTNISFKLYSEKKLLFNCPITDSIQTRWLQLSDQEIAPYLLPLKKTESAHGLTITGVISNQQYGRYDRSGIYFFVNNRWVKNHALNRAFINGYQNVLPTHQYPIGCIKITIDPQFIDVNIHPRKEEVQFLHAHKLYHALKKAISYTLETHLSEKFAAQKSTISAFEHTTPNTMLTSSHRVQTPQQFTPFNFDTFFDMPSKKSSEQIVPAQTPEIIQKQTNKTVPSDQATGHNFQIIGTYNKTYILMEQEDGLLFIDQHAAHERILYEQFTKKEKPATVQLLFPQTITLSKNDVQILTPYLSLLCNHGIETELFSDTQAIIKATPVQLKNSSMQEIVANCLALLHKEKSAASEIIATNFSKALHADMACKAAVKAGDELTSEQIHQLINDLDTTDNRFLCPHGRPTSWQLPHETIKKKFKRDYQ